MCNYRQLNTGAGVMCGWCLAYCTGVVLNTVRESATPDSKENMQADAGSRRFRRHFLCDALLCNFSSTEHEGRVCFVYFQVNNGIWSFLDYVEDIAAGRPLRLSSNLWLKPFALIVTYTSFLLLLHTDAVSILHLLPLLYTSLYGTL